MAVHELSRKPVPVEEPLSPALDLQTFHRKPAVDPSKLMSRCLGQMQSHDVRTLETCKILK